MRSLSDLRFQSPHLRLGAALLALLACNLPALCGPIHDAARDGDLARVQALLKADPQLVFSKDDDGLTPLHWAASGGELDRLAAPHAPAGPAAPSPSTAEDRDFRYAGVLEVLLANQADVNARDNRGKTSLHYAARYGQTKLAQLLLASDAVIDARDDEGWTPLFETVNSTSPGNPPLAPDATGSKSRPQPKAVRVSSPVRVSGKGMAELLLAKGADVNARDRSGWTPLCSAANQGNAAMVTLLLDNHAHAAAQCKSSGTALALAASGGYAEVVDLLDEHGRELAPVAKEYKAFIRGGSPRFESLLIRTLQSQGNEEMAQNYLNSGNPALEAAAHTWASARGYSILQESTGAVHERWGGGRQ